LIHPSHIFLAIPLSFFFFFFLFHSLIHIFFFYFSLILFYTHIFFFNFCFLDIFISLFKALNSTISCINTIWIFKIKPC
jgi:hypothetical protein